MIIIIIIILIMLIIKVIMTIIITRHHHQNYKHVGYIQRRGVWWQQHSGGLGGQPLAAGCITNLFFNICFAFGPFFTLLTVENHKNMRIESSDITLEVKLSLQTYLKREIE